jgi:hypothetical protein
VIPETDLAYLAGVIDVMGRVWTRPSSNGRRLPLLEINAKQPDLMDWLSALTGTEVITTSRDYMRLGCTEHCSEQHVHATSTSARWSITGAKATIVLSGIEPFSYLRRPEVEYALGLGMMAEMRAQTVRDMKARGWVIPPGAILSSGAKVA